MGKKNKTRSEKIAKSLSESSPVLQKAVKELSGMDIPGSEKFYAIGSLMLVEMAKNIESINISLAKIADYCDDLRAAEEERRFNEDF